MCLTQAIHCLVIYAAVFEFSRSYKGSSASHVVGADKVGVFVDKAVVGAGKAVVGANEAVVGVGDAEEGTLWTLISGVSQALDKDIATALQEAVDKHAPLKASVCELPQVESARLVAPILLEVPSLCSQGFNVAASVFVAKRGTKEAATG